MSSSTLQIPYTRRPLTEYDILALRKTRKAQGIEEQKTRDITGLNCLTQEEFEHLSEEAKRLLELAGEAIFIIPKDINKYSYTPTTPAELVEEKLLQRVTKIIHPRLKEFKRHLERNTPYSQFIKTTYGHIWPIMLRVQQQGLTSIQQFHSIMAVSYWFETGLKLKSTPIFEENGTLTPEGDCLVNNALFSIKTEQEKKDFLTDMRRTDIPKSEKDVLIVYLDINHFHAAIHAYENYFSLTNKDGELFLSILTKHDAWANPKQRYSREKTSSLIRLHGMRMFHAGIGTFHAYNKVFFLKNSSGSGRSPALILPSQTMREIWYKSLNPNRKMTIARRAGAYNIETMEMDCENNRHTVSLFAPIPNPDMAHGMPSNAAYNELHDGHHSDWNAHVDYPEHQQLLRAKNILRPFYPDKKMCTSSILRLLEREISPETLDFKSMHYKAALFTFPFLKELTHYGAPCTFASTILLVDILLYPEKWPSFSNSELKELLFKKLLHHKETMPSIEELEVITQHYKTRIQSHHIHSMVAILVLCRFYLNDVELCDLLLNDPLRHGGHMPFRWKKQPHGDLYPVLIAKNREFPFEELAELTPRKRMQLFTEALAYRRKSLEICRQFSVRPCATYEAKEFRDRSQDAKAISMHRAGQIGTVIGKKKEIFSTFKLK